MAELSSSALIILAAGSSSRMGRPKQLLPVGGCPLLRRVAEACVGSGIANVIVVLGSNAEEIRPALAGLSVHIVVNENWPEGMGSSVRAGMTMMASVMPAAKGVVIALADQPKFSTRHITRLFDAQRETGGSIVASRYKEKLSPPALFAQVYFPALRALQGDTGARSLFQKHRWYVSRSTKR